MEAGKVLFEEYHDYFVKGIDDGRSVQSALECMELFHVVVALESKWADEVLFKCSCKRCMQCGVCVHALLCSMVCDGKITIPSRNVRQSVQARRKRGCPGNGPAGDDGRAAEGERRDMTRAQDGYKQPTVRGSH